MTVSHPDPWLSRKLKFTCKGRRHKYHWGGGLQPLKCQRGCPVEGYPASPSSFWRSRWHLLTSEGGKIGISGAISGECPCSSLICFGSFRPFWKQGRKGFAVLVLRHCVAPSPFQQGEGEGPLLPAGLPPMSPQLLACRHLLSFACGFLLKFSLGLIQRSEGLLYISS